MNLAASARVALTALRTNTLRTSLAMLGIIIGVGAFIASGAIGAGAQTRIAEQIRSLGSNLLIILSGSLHSGGIRLGSGTQLSITEDDAAAVAREVSSVLVTARNATTFSYVRKSPMTPTLRTGSNTANACQISL